MRIIAGKYKGRRLVSFRAPHIRPTSDIVKESLFNMLAFHLPEAKVLDLFAGTGSLSLEALSRGAARVVSVEKHPKSISILEQNKNLLQIFRDELQVVQKDVFSFLKQYSGDAFDIVIIDPPFTKKIAHSVMEALVQSRIFHKETLVCLESSHQEALLGQYGVWKRVWKKDFGDKDLSRFEVES